MPSSIVPNLNQAVAGLPESATFVIQREVIRLRAEGKQVYNFGLGQSPMPVHPKLEAKLKEHAHQTNYLPTQGLRELREKICQFRSKKFGQEISPEHVLIGPGSKELIFLLLYSLDGPLFLPTPCWVSYAPQAKIQGREIQLIPTSRETGFKLTADRLDEALAPRKGEQCILLINSPNNPTGAVYKRDEVKAITECCKKHNVILIADEIYSLITYSGEQYTSFSHYYPEGTIVSSGLSKGFSCGGWRLGYLAAPPALAPVLSAVRSIASETYSAACTPVQHAAVTAYEEDSELDTYLNCCTEIHRLACHYVHQRFVEIGIDCLPPDGAFYLFPNFEPFRKLLLQKGVNTPIELCQYLLREASFAMLPGDAFCYPDSGLCGRVAVVDYDGGVFLKELVRGADVSDECRFVEKHAPNLKDACDSLANALNSP